MQALHTRTFPWLGTLLLAAALLAILLATQSGYVRAAQQTEAYIERGARMPHAEALRPRVTEALMAGYERGLQRIYPAHVAKRIASSSPQVFAPALVLLWLLPLSAVACAWLNARTRVSPARQLLRTLASMLALASAAFIAIGVGNALAYTPSHDAWSPVNDPWLSRIAGSHVFWSAALASCVAHAAYASSIVARFRSPMRGAMVATLGVYLVWLLGMVGVQQHVAALRWCTLSPYAQLLLSDPFSLAGLVAHLAFALACCLLARVYGATARAGVVPAHEVRSHAASASPR